MDTKKLRQKILDLAIRGKLVPQDPNDEPASVLLQRIRAEKERLIKEGKIKLSKKTTSDEEIEAPFEIPESWVWCKLDDLAFYKKGPFGSSLTKSMFVPDASGVYKVYEQKNAINKDASLGHYFIDSAKYEELKGFAVLPSDIIVSCAGTIGETYVLPQGIRKGIINQALMLIRLYDSSITDFYLLYFDFILKNEAAKESKGTAIKNIPPFEVLKNFLIPIPPLTEQQRIANEVERWFSLIDALESNECDLLKSIDQAKSKILDLAIHGKLVPQDPNDEPAIELLKRINPKFEACENVHDKYLPYGWQICSVKDVFQINPKTSVADNLDAAFVPMTNIEDQYNNKFVFETRKWGDIKRGYTHFQDEDIAVAKISPCLENRKSVVFSNLPNGIGAGTTELNVFRSEIVNPLYGLYFFKSNHFILKCIGTFNGVVGQQRVATKYLESIIFFLPPYQEQLRIVSKIEELFAVLDGIKLLTN